MNLSLFALFLTVCAETDEVVKNIFKNELKFTAKNLENIDIDEFMHKLFVKGNLDKELFDAAFEFADLNEDEQVTLGEIIHKGDPGNSILKFASFQYLVGNEKGRKHLVKKVVEMWNEHKYMALNRQEFIVFWTATQMAKVDAWYMEYDADGDEKLNEQELEVAEHQKAAILKKYKHRTKWMQAPAESDAQIRQVGTRAALFLAQLHETSDHISDYLDSLDVTFEGSMSFQDEL